MKSHTVEKEIFISQDGKTFTDEKSCLYHESCIRGKSIVKFSNFVDESRYYFKADNEETWRDCLTYLGSRLYTDFLAFNDFKDFREKWCFTEYDVAGEFYRLYDRENIISKFENDICDIQGDIDKLNLLDNYIEI